MGYRVGQICYGTQIEAQNHVMSQVIPTIDKDGVLNHPVFIGSAWEYHGNQVKINFPQCNNQDFYDQGRELGQSIATCFYRFIYCRSLPKSRKTGQYSK